MLSILAGMADQAVTVTPDTPRAMQASDYAAMLTEAGLPAEPAATVRDGLMQARKLAGEDGIIIASGSLYFAGELRSELGLSWQ